MPDPLPEPPRSRAADPDAEAARIEPAMRAVADELGTLAAAASGELAEVLSATAMMAGDPAVLAEAVRLARTDGLSAERAVWDAFASFRAALAGAGGYLAERVTDLDDVRNRIVARLLGVAPPGIPDPGHPYVLVARDLAPADTASLDPGCVLGFVTELGGPTSHTAILAKSLGTPAVVACPGAERLTDGALLAMDGVTGQVVVDPDDDTVAAATARAARRHRPQPLGDGSGRTADGVPVLLLANVGDPAAAAQACASGAHGVGLFRTEFLFLDHAEPPDVDDQADQYAAVFAEFPGRKVVVRTLDAGADKPLPFLGDLAEPNPALGVRGIRVSHARADVLTTQLEAIAIAARRGTAEVHVMAPMVATQEEAVQFVASTRAAGLGRAGIMVEVPAAVLLADEIFPTVDFISIGTNDLTQYTYAADRLLAPLARLNDYWQPAVTRLIDHACRSARTSGTPVGVCGESASDPAYAVVLVGLGARSLSMAPGCLSAVNDLLALVTLEQCQAAARAAAGAPTAEAARAEVRRALPQLEELGL